MQYKNVAELQGFMEKCFILLGVTEPDAEICAKILITSDLRGIESHGIGRLRMYVDRIHKGLIETNALLKSCASRPQQPWWTAITALAWSSPTDR
jgi:LDH2 family malate/lactate/ureidoglycolate dehydrogenase